MLATWLASLPLLFPVRTLELPSGRRVVTYAAASSGFPRPTGLAANSVVLPSAVDSLALIRISGFTSILSFNISAMQNTTTYLCTSPLECLEDISGEMHPFLPPPSQEGQLHPSSCWGQRLAIVLDSRFPTSPLPTHPSERMKNLITLLPPHTTLSSFSWIPRWPANYYSLTVSFQSAARITFLFFLLFF